jgi:trk system potassium uptake protein TrkA
MKVLLVGNGATTFHLARQFATRGHGVTVVDPDPAHALLLSRRLEATVIAGDGTDPGVLERAGVRKADAVLALADRDHENLAVCRAAQLRFGVPRTIALVHDPENEEVFRRLGVTAALSATRILAQVVESVAGFASVATLVHAAGGRIAIGEVVLSDSAPVLGQAVRDIPFPDGALLGCVVRDGEAIVPRGDTVLLHSDRLVVIARPDIVGALVSRLSGDRV